MSAAQLVPFLCLHLLQIGSLPLLMSARATGSSGTTRHSHQELTGEGLAGPRQCGQNRACALLTYQLCSGSWTLIVLAVPDGQLV